MKFTQLTHYFNADEAATIITFLDDLKEALWSNYGSEIIEIRKESAIEEAKENLIKTQHDTEI